MRASYSSAGAAGCMVGAAPTLEVGDGMATGTWREILDLCAPKQEVVFSEQYIKHCKNMFGYTPGSK